MALKSSVERAQRKAGGFATAKKNIVIQYGGRERTEENILNVIQNDLREKGIKDEEVELLDVYIKPEDGQIFYVVNKTIEGSVAY